MLQTTLAADTPPPENIAARVAKARASLVERGYDAVLVTGPESKGWLSAFTSGLFIAPGGAIVLTRDEAVFVTTQVDEAECRAGVPHMRVVAFDHEQEDLPERVVLAAAEAGVTRVAIEATDLTAAEARRYERLFAERGIATDITDPLIAPLRYVKDAWEVEQIRQANRVNRTAFMAILDWIRPSVTEWQLAVELERQLRLHGTGSARMSFQAMVASGPNSALAHASVTHRSIQPGDFVMLDFGATWNGYCSDCTRTVVVGQASEPQRALYSAVLAAQEAAIAAIQPAESCARVHEVAMERLRAAGYGAYTAHGLGHGVGIQLFDGPLLRPRSRDVFQPGHVVTVEPGLYVPGLGGVRIEDNVLVTEVGHENLTTAPKQLLEL